MYFADWPINGSQITGSHGLTIPRLYTTTQHTAEQLLIFVDSWLYYNISKCMCTYRLRVSLTAQAHISG